MCKERYKEQLMYVLWCRARSASPSNADSLKRYICEKKLAMSA